MTLQHLHPRPRAIAYLVLLIVCPVAHADPADPPTSLLCIGNSFSDNATRFLDDLAEAGGHPLVIGRAALGGAALDRHAHHAAAFAANPDDPEARPYGVKRFPGLDTDQPRVGLPEALAYRRWDVVTIQQVSTKSFDPATYEPFATQLIELIREYQPDARIFVHQTWAYRLDSDRLTQWGMTQEQMHAGLVRAYDRLAQTHDLPQLPTGDAFALARATPTWRYQVDADFDPLTAPADTLPDQAGSLIVGYHLRKDQTRAFDSIHANVAGQYLAACTWYATLFDQDVTALDWHPEALTPPQAASLRELAQQAADAERAGSSSPPSDALPSSGPLPSSESRPSTEATKTSRQRAEPVPATP